MNRYQRGGAGGVDRQRGPPDAEQIGEPAGRRGVRTAGASVRVGPQGPARRKQVAIIGRADADEDADLLRRQALRHDAGILQGLPVDFEQLALLRIHELRLAWRDAEKRRAELIEIRNKGSGSGVHLALGIRVGIIVRVYIPALGRYFADRVSAARQEIPEFVGVRAAWKAARHADDGNGLEAFSRGRLRLDWTSAVHCRG